MPATKASVDSFVSAQAKLDAYDSGRAAIVAERDAALAALGTEMEPNETVSAVANPTPHIRKDADGTIHYGTHDYPKA